ncbi:MAG: hypothetical protein E7500_05095 [Ruminococcus sp.]|nr:hypothetical protein [Ruminococcus sp.]
MKKLICLALCTIALVGCSKADKTSDASSEIINTTESSEVELCILEDHSAEYESMKNFLETGAKYMFYHKVGSDEKINITPYAVEYDEEKYDLTKVMRIDYHIYTYFFKEKSTNNTINFEFCYGDGTNSLEDVWTPGGFYPVTVDFSGNPQTEIRIVGDISKYGIILVTDEKCKLHISCRMEDDLAQQAINDGVSYQDLALDLLNDFTISKA